MWKLLVFLTGLTLAASRRHHPFYRKDYVFFDEYDAFYKFHWDISGISWNSAFLACDDEGAKLFYPKEPAEWTIVKNLTSMMVTEPNVTEIFVGIHDEFGLGEYITVDGQATPSPLSEDQIVGSSAEGFPQCVVMDVESGNYRVDSCMNDPDTIRPYVCKKIDDNPCPTIDSGYEYVRASKKCYKVHNREKNWHDAMQTCFMEGGLLIVIDSNSESKIIYDKITSNFNKNYFVGFRKMSDGEFYTVKGQNLETRYELWYDRPNDEGNNCGAIYSYSNQLYTRTQHCENRLPFICEMSPRA